MSVFKRAILYLTRKKMRSILLFLLLFFMGNRQMLCFCDGRQQRQGEGRAAEAFLAGFVRMGF